MHNLSHQSLHQMESAISLRYCPFPYGSKGFQFQAARPSRIHLRFNHATPLCVPQLSTATHPVTRSFRHANCMLERFSVPSENEGKRGNKIVRRVTAVSLVLACVLGLFNISAKMNPKFTTAYAFPWPGTSSNSKTAPIDFESSTKTFMVDSDGRSTLVSLLSMITDAQRSTDQNQYKSRSNLPPSQQQVNQLKKLAIGKSKSKEALEKLEKHYRDSKISEEAKSYIGVALVEVFLFQGNFEEALKRLDQQIDEILGKEYDERTKCNELLDCYEAQKGDVKLGIAQRILYKAIVHTMLGDEKAKEWWEAFISLSPVEYPRKLNK